MGSGSWSSKSFSDYTRSSKNVATVDDFVSGSYNAQDIFTSRRLDPVLNPRNVVRECCDSEEHPNTLPVILALDVTGSMGDAAVQVAQQLNTIMTNLYADESLPDVQFCVVGIGDLAYDDAPLQISQFESDIRIAEQLDKVYFEFGGGGNGYESYTGAWYLGVNHCRLDCWKRDKKGIIITMGDESLNPYLPKRALNYATGDTLEVDVETSKLYKQAKEKYNLYHIYVKHGYSCSEEEDLATWKKVLGNNVYVENLDSISNRIVEIVKSNINSSNGEEISW